MIPVTITHIGQSLDLRRKSFDHTLKLALPDGTIINATVDEMAVERLMKFVADDGSTPSPRSSSEAEPQDMGERSSSAEDTFVDGLYDGEPARMFGGDGQPNQQEEEEAPAPPPQPPPAPVRGAQLVIPQPTRIRTVPKDEKGYPLVTPTGVDAGSVLAESIEDDGVPQI
jgi:hypothetical protein